MTRTPSNFSRCSLATRERNTFASAVQSMSGGYGQGGSATNPVIMTVIAIVVWADSGLVARQKRPMH